MRLPGVGRAGREPERTPARPGPGPTPEALVRALDLAVGRRVRGLVTGEFRSAATGSGTDLARIRPYVPGDDVRQIDWNVTARTNEPHVRLHLPERAVTTWLLLDVSPSMAFGTADRRKADVAEGVSVAIGHLATRHGNRLAVLTYGDGGGDGGGWRSSPAGGRGGLLTALVAARQSTVPDPTTSGPGAPGLPGPSSPAEPLRLVASAAPPGGVVVVVSDFRGPRDWRGRLAECAARHETIAVEIRDPREDDLPDVGEL
ncbi:MAG TPA: DUF58 domain-containing protein, partial [Candidatus Limnocylindrales bacterium]|nr:DUF58 domain-containing protein [Candidatus Limnocylindrales bacterium]